MWIWTLWIVKRAWIHLSNSSDHRLQKTGAVQERVAVSNEGYSEKRYKITVQSMHIVLQGMKNAFYLFWMAENVDTFQRNQLIIPYHAETSPYPKHILRDDWKHHRNAYRVHFGSVVTPLLRQNFLNCQLKLTLRIQQWQGFFFGPEVVSTRVPP